MHMPPNLLHREASPKLMNYTNTKGNVLPTDKPVQSSPRLGALDLSAA